MRKLILLACLLAPVLAAAPPRAAGQTYLGDYTGYEVRGRAVTVTAGSSALRFILYRSDMVRVDLLPTASTTIDSSFAVVADTTYAPLPTLTEDTEALTLSTDRLRVRIAKHPVRFAVSTAAGELLVEEPASGGLGFAQIDRFARFRLDPQTRFYGSGFRGGALDLRGRVFDLYNTPTFGYGGAPDVMGVNVSFLTSPSGYGLFFDTSYPLQVNLGASIPDIARVRAVGGEMSLFVIAGETVADQLEAFTWLTGRQPMPPKWSLGYIQSRFGYRNADELRDTAARMRDHHIPCDALVIDLDWFPEMGDLTWDRSAWPDPADMTADLRADGFRTITITEPYVVSRTAVNFAEGSRRGYFGARADGSVYLIPDWWSCGCDAALLDLTDPEVRSWWWTRHAELMGSGVAGLWTDLGEPENHPWDMRHHLGSTAKVHNIYNLLWARAVFEGFAKDRPGERLMNLTRAGSAGIQRYGVIPWSGDVSRSFAGLDAQVALLLQSGMSGLGYFNSDIGGFCCGTTSSELYVRWMQFGAFCPVTRAHGTGQPTEPWAFGAQAEQVCRRFIELRYRLLPYIYDMARRNHDTGLPLARPLFFEDPDDPLLTNYRGAYLFGDAFLVSPVTVEGRRSQPVRLPPGDWIDFWTDRLQPGDTTITAEAPLESMPLFVRAGSLVPTRPLAQHTGAIAADTLIMWSYPMDASSQTHVLYEDDGLTRAHENGTFRTTPIRQSVTGSGKARRLELAVGPSEGDYAGAPQHRTVRFEVHGMPLAPTSVTADGEPLAPTTSRAEAERSTGVTFYDPDARLLIISIGAAVDEERRVVAEGIGAPFGSEDEPSNAVYGLRQSSPNPMVGSTRIPYSLREGGDVEFAVYDVLGRRIYAVRRENLEAGDHVEEFRRDDVGGRALAGGVYFYSLKAWTRTANDGRLLIFEDARKMVVLN